MSNKKMKTCASCGAEIAKTAKSCPSCGAKNKKPIYLRPWFIVLILFIVIGAMAGTGGSSSNTDSSKVEEQEEITITYTPCTVDELVEVLEENALKANETWNGEYVELTGKLSTIDSSGDYISLSPVDSWLSFTNVLCYIENDDQLNRVMDMNVDEIVTLRGKITDVGEVLGYYLDIIEIVS
mgnify:CR=1 FL=1